MNSANRAGGKDEDLVQVLGYMNFSSGKPDGKTLGALNRLYGWAIAGNAIPGRPFAGMPAWLTIQQWLQDRLKNLSKEKNAFEENAQASQVLKLVWLHLLPDYLDFHNDLLFHHEPEGVFNGFFLGRAIEAVLQQGSPWQDTERIVKGAIRQLNDYVGYRPVAVLEGRRLEPYPHEWLRPIPLYISEVGVAFGPYHEIIEQALKILRQTSPDILQQAHFDLELLDELALDPRAYDFDHPVNKRPNYHFGIWDPHRIDQRGYYRRFVIQQVTIDALLARVQQEKELPQSELIFEAASVLAGTMLMASAVCGWGPTAFASTVTLASLMDPIAKNRDAFYDQLLSRMSGPHADRLLAEQKIRRQAFGGARQHLNTQLARLRASQLEHVILARLFARMGCPPAAKEESDHVHVPSARILCQIDCLLTEGSLCLRKGDLAAASNIAARIKRLLEVGIHCGAIVDPWNIMGFAGNFSRFHGPDSAVHDHRIDELVQLMEQVFAFQSRLWRESAARDDSLTSERAEADLRALTDWWRKYAAHEVGELQATDAKDNFESAKLVATALQLWYRGGASAGDIRFWAPHAALFDSPKAYSLVIEALLERRDFVASMALLVHWLCESSRVGLQSGNVVFSDIAKLWLETLHRTTTLRDGTAFTPSAKWEQIVKFFDYIEANGESLCQPPEFLLAAPRKPKAKELESNFEDFDEDSPAKKFDSAYEDVVYQDSTDDGMEGATFEEETDTQDELAAESKRLGEHLAFQSAIALMWKLVAQSSYLFHSVDDATLRKKQSDALERWCQQATLNQFGQTQLFEQVHRYRLVRGGADQDSMARYDRKRVLKEMLLEKAIGAAVETADASRMLLATLLAQAQDNPNVVAISEKLDEEDQFAVKLFAELIAGQRSQVEDQFSQYLNILRTQKLLYVPLSRNGDPEQIFAVRSRRRVLTHLLTWLPRQGLFFQAIQLIENARFMEHQNPVGPGAVTEFDELFQMAYKSMVRCLIRNAYSWSSTGSPSGTIGDKGSSESGSKPTEAEPSSEKESIYPSQTPELDQIVERSVREPDSEMIIPLLEQLTEVLLGSWLAHSRTLRLSVLETVDNSTQWKRLVAFIEEYGKGLFTQQFLKLGNVRAILHQGVATWLNQAAEDGDQEEVQPILDAIEEGKLDREEAHRWLSVVLEAVIDHYTEYRDYNSTTTQSDRGEMLYMLLDFLRLRVRYDRVSWNLRPVFWAHEVLVRSGCRNTAMAWRRALAERIGREADQYLTQLKKLQEQYAMRMPTVADRLGERFIKPMNVDRMRALIRPAMNELLADPEGKSANSFQLLVQEARLMTQEPTGVGLDVPPWLVSLEEEVERQLEYREGITKKTRTEQSVPMIFLSPQEIESQLLAVARQSRKLN